MSKVIERCAGIDIGKRFLMCCVVTGAADQEPRSQTLRFDTTVPALERMREWLHRERVTHVVMESTGSYWVPVFNILEETTSPWCWLIQKRLKTARGTRLIAKTPST